MRVCRQRRGNQVSGKDSGPSTVGKERTGVVVRSRRVRPARESSTPVAQRPTSADSGQGLAGRHKKTATPQAGSYT